MTKPNLYIYIVILFLIMLILSLIAFALQRKKDWPTLVEPTAVIQPTPTTIEVRTTIPSTPTEIPPTSTGVFEEELPKNLQDLSTQKQDLKSKVPINNPNFVITFDYGEDKFVVELQEPKAQSQVRFKEWLNTNYPAIPLDRFIIK